MAFVVPRLQEFCPRCKCLVRVPESLPLDVFAEAIALRRSGSTLQAVAAVARSGRADLGESKCFVFHLTQQPGHCHRCRKPLVAGVAECAVCRCINLDFTAPPNSNCED